MGWVQCCRMMVDGDRLALRGVLFYSASFLVDLSSSDIFFLLLAVRIHLQVFFGLH